MLIGRIYGYRSNGRWIYVGQTSRTLAARHRGHEKRFERLRINWDGPILLEEVKGIDRQDLQQNLSWQETIWMFKLHTYRRIFSKGMNVTLPFGQDYFYSGKSGGLIGGLIGAPRAKEWFENHPELAFKIHQNAGRANKGTSISAGYHKRKNCGRRKGTKTPWTQELMTKLNQNRTKEERSSLAQKAGTSGDRSAIGKKAGFISGLKKAIIKGIEKELASWQYEIA